MKKYKKEELIKNAPRGATHLLYNEYSYTYIMHSVDGHRVWLGLKHGGWSFKLEYQHPNYNKLINIPRKPIKL